MAGGVSGAVTAAIFREKPQPGLTDTDSQGSRRNILPGMLTFSMLGFMGQMIVNTRLVNESDPQERNSGPGMWQRFLSSKYNLMTKLTDEEYEDILQERLLRVEAEIALVDEKLGILKNSNASDDEKPK